MPASWDLICASDVFYDPQLAQPLAETLAALFIVDPRASALLALSDLADFAQPNYAPFLAALDAAVAAGASTFRLSARRVASVSAGVPAY